MWSTPRDRQRAAGEHCWHDATAPWDELKPYIYTDKLDDGMLVQTRVGRQRCCHCGAFRTVYRMRQQVIAPEHGRFQPDRWDEWRISDVRGGAARCHV